MSDGIVFIDGEYMRPEDARMSIFDAGVRLGATACTTSPPPGTAGSSCSTSIWSGSGGSCEGFRLENPCSFEEMRRI